MAIRLATPGDAEWVSLFMEVSHYAAHGKGAILWDPNAADAAMAQLDGVHGAIFVAEDGGERIGVLAAQISAPYYAPRAALCVALYFWVDAAARGKGHGKALIERMETWATEHGAQACLLTAASGTPSAGVFEGLGYEQVESVHMRRL